MARKTTLMNVEILEPEVDTDNRLSRVGYVSPMDHYIHSPEKITIKELAISWKGTKHCRHYTLANRAVREGWLQKRKEFWERAAKRAEEKLEKRASREIYNANLRHTGLGKALQGTAAKVLRSSVEELTKRPDDIKPGEGLRVASTLAKAGVDIERKGLGLVDSVSHLANVKEMVAKILGVVAKHVQEPDILKNIVYDLRSIEEEEERVVREDVMMLSGPEDDIDP